MPKIGVAVFEVPEGVTVETVRLLGEDKEGILDYIPLLTSYDAESLDSLPHPAQLLDA